MRTAVLPKGVPGERVGRYRLDAPDSFAGSFRLRAGGFGSMQASRWAVGTSIGEANMGML